MAIARVGLAGTVNRNTGNYATPIWVEITLVADVQENVSWDQADASDRASRIKRFVKTMLDVGVTLRVRNDLTDSGYDALWTSLFSPTSVMDLLILDGPTTEIGAQGLRADWQIMSGNQSQALSDALFREFELRPSIETNPPKYAEVTATDTITYTAIA